MEFYFKKEFFINPAMEKLTRCIVPVQYYECSRCGFLSSITHQQLSEIQWSKLNHDFHHYNESASREELGFQQPPYAEQAMMIEILIRNEFLMVVIFLTMQLVMEHLVIFLINIMTEK